MSRTPVAPSAVRPRRVVIVTNIPAPYRLPVYSALAREPGLDLHVVFCGGREPDRQWDLGAFEFPHEFLRERWWAFHGRYIHANPDVWKRLTILRPDAVVTTGFNPTHLLAFAWARSHGVEHLAMTDGTLRSESGLSGLHRLVRHWVYRRSAAFIGASEGSFELYRGYGVLPSAMFQSHLCADNAAFTREPERTRHVDLLFCGRFVSLKRPLFALDVAAEVARRLRRRVRIRFLGAGPLESQLRERAAQLAGTIDVEFPGFARQHELPSHYARAKLLLFPTVGDTWGVVANEACASGVPVITAPEAGVAGELVRDGDNGRVLRMDLATWAKAAAQLLDDEPLRARMAARGRELVRSYDYACAAQGLARAVRHAWRGRNPALQPVAFAPEVLPQRQRPRVVIMQRRLTHYRVPLFEEMRRRLAQEGVDLDLVVGDPTPDERLKADLGHLDWARHVPCHYALGGKLCLQWAMDEVRGADLVVVTQENKLLFNLLLMLRRSRHPMAFWGHGRNFQVGPGQGRSEALKRRLIKCADWWFAYTDLSRDIVAQAGFPSERISVLDNSDDTATLRRNLAAADQLSEAQMRARFGLGGGPVVLILSSIYPSKRIDVSLELVRRARERRPDLELLILGDGPDRKRLQADTESLSWIHWAGARGGLDKAAALRLARVLVQPYIVGLLAVDSLVAGVPILTQPDGDHSPEIAYLQADVNCAMASGPDPDILADALIALLEDDPRRAALAARCLKDGERFSVEGMAQRFCDGLLLALRGAPAPSATSTRQEAAA